MTSDKPLSTQALESGVRLMPRPTEAARMNTEELRSAFLIEKLFTPGKLRYLLTDLDRFLVGGAMPDEQPLVLDRLPELRTPFVLERREFGAINIGGPARVTADGQAFELAAHDGLYAGLGTKALKFESADAANPAKLYWLSCPAHRAYPTTAIRLADATKVTLGEPALCNVRTINKYIHPGGVPSCQLVMGMTALASGSAWNSFPPHTHARRSEVYFYFDFADRVLAHFMGAPQQTRHLFLQNEQAVLSPAWSIHAGCGLGAYRFIWGMAGENQSFDDMDGAKLAELK